MQLYINAGSMTGNMILNVLGWLRDQLPLVCLDIFDASRVGKVKLRYVLPMAGQPTL